MKRVLLTGISGVGKSAAIVELAQHGHMAVDLDNDDFSEWVEVAPDGDEYGSTVEPGRDWVWREDRVHHLLSHKFPTTLFVSGTAPNMGKFLPQFDHIVLLSAPSDLILERLASRTNNPYGKRPEEAARVLKLKESVEPILRGISGHEIDTSASLESVVSRVLEVAKMGGKPHLDDQGGP